MTNRTLTRFCLSDCRMHGTCIEGFRVVIIGSLLIAAEEEKTNHERENGVFSHEVLLPIDILGPL